MTALVLISGPCFHTKKDLRTRDSAARAYLHRLNLFLLFASDVSFSTLPLASVFCFFSILCIFEFKVFVTTQKREHLMHQSQISNSPQALCAIRIQNDVNRFFWYHLLGAKILQRNREPGLYKSLRLKRGFASALKWEVSTVQRRLT